MGGLDEGHTLLGPWPYQEALASGGTLMRDMAYVVARGSHTLMSIQFNQVDSNFPRFPFKNMRSKLVYDVKIPSKGVKWPD